MDTTSGYPYFWNTKTNEVRWDRPPAAAAPPAPLVPPPVITQPPVPAMLITKPPLPADPNRETISSYPPVASPAQTAPEPKPVERPAKSSGQSKKSKKAAAAAAAAAFIGPSLPPVKPEDLALGKIRQFEEKLATGVCSDLEKEVPPDWVRRDEKRSPMPRPIYTKPFAWRKREPVGASVESLEHRSKSNPIAMIAGYDSDHEQHPSDASPEKEDANRSSRKMIQVKVRSKKYDQVSLAQLKPVPSIFRERTSSGSSRGSADENEDHPSPSSTQRTTPEKKQKKTTNGSQAHIKKAVKGYDVSAGPSYKKSIDQVGETLCDKLEFLRVDKIEISPLKLLAVQTETIFEAWQSGALSPGYMQKYLSSLSTRLVEIESEHLAPPGWRAVWMRSSKRYEYENLETGETQTEKPEEPRPETEVAQKPETEVISLLDEDEGDDCELPPLPPEDPPPLPPDPQGPPPPPPPPPEDDGGDVTPTLPDGTGTPPPPSDPPPLPPL